MPNNDSEVKEIQADLKKSGFPLEIVVSSILAKKGWTVRNQAYYTDQTENKGRTVDIMSHKAEFGTIGDYDRINLTLIIECKKSNKPWLFYTNKMNTEEKDLNTIATIKQFSNPYILNNNRFVSWLTKSCHYSSKFLEDFGFNYYEPFKEGKGIDILTAFHQVSKSLDFMMRQSEEFAQIYSKRAGFKPLFIWYPIIVFDGHLYEYKIEGEECQLVRRQNFTYHLCQEKNYFVDIVEKEYFPIFLEKIDQEFLDLIAVLGNHEQAVTTAL